MKDGERLSKKTEDLNGIERKKTQRVVVKSISQKGNLKSELLGN